MSTARKIIQIDEALCNGCGLCAGACHEGAIAMVNGKAKLVREDPYDGRPPMDLPDLLDEMDRGLEEDR